MNSLEFDLFEGNQWDNASGKREARKAKRAERKASGKPGIGKKILQGAGKGLLTAVQLGSGLLPVGGDLVGEAAAGLRGKIGKGKTPAGATPPFLPEKQSKETETAPSTEKPKSNNNMIYIIAGIVLVVIVVVFMIKRK